MAAGRFRMKWTRATTGIVLAFAALLAAPGTQAAKR